MTYFNKDSLTPSTAFSDKQQQNLFLIEDNSWWFQYRATVIISLMKQFFNPLKTTFDIGGGNGYTTSVAQKAGFQMALIEPSQQACQNALKRGIQRVTCGTIENVALDASLEQILLLDVLEHIEYDEDFVDKIYQKLQGGGGVPIDYSSCL